MAIDLIKKGGKIIIEGVYKGKISFPMFLLNSKEASIKGVLSHDREDILRAIDFFANNSIDTSLYLSEVMPLSKIQEAFERYIDPKNRTFVKIAIKISNHNSD